MRGWPLDLCTEFVELGVRAVVRLERERESARAKRYGSDGRRTRARNSPPPWARTHARDPVRPRQQWHQVNVRRVRSERRRRRQRQRPTDVVDRARPTETQKKKKNYSKVSVSNLFHRWFSSTKQNVTLADFREVQTFIFSHATLFIFAMDGAVKSIIIQIYNAYERFMPLIIRTISNDLIQIFDSCFTILFMIMLMILRDLRK